MSRASFVELCALWGMLLGPNGGARERRAARDPQWATHALDRRVRTPEHPFERWERRESPPTDDRAARPKAALEDAAGPMERDRTTTSMAVSARPAAPGTTGFEDAQAPVLPSHPMRPR